jgi:hypothetical protein
MILEILSLLSSCNTLEPSALMPRQSDAASAVNQGALQKDVENSSAAGGVAPRSTPI